MKKFVLSALSLILLSSVTYAQKNVIKIRPLSLLVGSFDLTYERVLTDKISVGLNGNYTTYNLTGIANSYNTSTSEFTKVRLSAYTIMPQCRIYFKKEAPSGFYLAPYLKYSNAGIAVDIKDDAGAVSSGAINVGIIGGGAGIGYQWVSSGGFSVDWNFFGLGIDAYNISLHYDNSSIDAINDAEKVRDQLNAAALFSGFGVSFPESGGITVSAPAQFVPALKINLSIGYAF